MKRWALLVAFLYFLILLVLTGPVIWLAFWPEVHLLDTAEIYFAWPYWVFIAVMVLSQAALLTVPVGKASGRPLTRRSLFLPVLVTGLMTGFLVVGALFALYEFSFEGRGVGGNRDLWLILLTGGLTWVFWTAVFYRLSRNENPADLISRQCRALLAGSILELLIAIPTHLIARSRNYCCAGLMTFIGLTLGISIMLLSYGPGVYFLFLDRWRRLYHHPEPE